jgi:hypothetical protein
VRIPSPSYREYGEDVGAVLITIAVLQYVGMLGPPGDIDLPYIVVTAVSLPVFMYILTVGCENISWLPQRDRMVQRDD